MPQATIVTLVTAGPVARRAMLMARSMRDFGGSIDSLPILAMVPGDGARLSRRDAAVFESLGVRLIPFDVDPGLRGVPFAAKVAGAALAEAVTDTDLLVWLDADTLVVQDGGRLLIPEDIVVGYRPVHHRLVGPSWDEPLDTYWRTIYDVCNVPADRVFRMATNVGEPIMPYLSAGVFTVRPERELLRQWPGALYALSHEPKIADQFRVDRRYEIFLHQVAWTAVALRSAERHEMMELHPSINYPLHLHEEIPARRRAISLDTLVAVRTEDLLDDPEWREQVPLLEPLADWIEHAAPRQRR